MSQANDLHVGSKLKLTFKGLACGLSATMLFGKNLGD